MKLWLYTLWKPLSHWVVRKRAHVTYRVQNVDELPNKRRPDRLYVIRANTMTSSLWRMVEALDVPALGLVGPPPWESVTSDGDPCRYFIRSAKFVEQFANVTEQYVCSVIRYCSTYRSGGPIADDDVLLLDDRGQKHVFHLESFYNRYEVLTLLIYKELLPAKIPVTSVRLPKSDVAPITS